MLSVSENLKFIVKSLGFMQQTLTEKLIMACSISIKLIFHRRVTNALVLIIF